jgi:hypothetical protein
MRKYTDDDYQSVCLSCIVYLENNIQAEMGIFRCGVSQTDVRKMLNTLLVSDIRAVQSGNDIYLVAEVLHSTLKAMSLSVLAEWYDHVTHTGKPTKHWP